ncbi:PREDICTED: SH2 domain-containing protein 1A [Nanorana parkeri]|uniref:SH2 domain-containing protein 1A n=1 Tax=Nanorana parkeri TaxID=125878 RepID=UPI0008544D33|nr:PREDICTED: SH2 domain-containing protein 1A [Nanorana parkeri]
MENVSVYHGRISREIGEKLLSEAGKDGSYLLRDSETVPGVYCLCVLHKDVVYTYRVSQTITGSWSAEAAPGVPKRMFRKVQNLISAYQKPGQGIATHLQHPVERKTPKMKVDMLNTLKNQTLFNCDTKVKPELIQSCNRKGGDIDAIEMS